MEGLTIAPDGTMLVVIMQSALDQADLGGFDAKKLAPIRIVTYRFADGALREYLYLLENPATTKIKRRRRAKRNQRGAGQNRQRRGGI